MSRIGYLIKRVCNMNFKEMFTTVNEVSKKINKPKIIVFLDIVYCGIKYQAGYTDYYLFAMYELDREKRKTIVTRGINDELIRKYNNPKYIKYFSSKIEFNMKFNKYLKRDWLELEPDEESLKMFKTFANKYHRIVAKTLSLSSNEGVEIIKVNRTNSKEVFNMLIGTNRTLIEEVATECEELKNLNPTSLNTIRIVTLNKEIVAAYLKIGNNNIVDNFEYGGLVAPINISTGLIDYLAVDKDGVLYKEHPITKENILWFSIPKWKKIIKFIHEVCDVVPEIGYIGWDVAIDKEPYLIKGNCFPEHNLYQLPPHRTSGEGLLPVFKKAIEKEKEK